MCKLKFKKVNLKTQVIFQINDSLQRLKQIITSKNIQKIIQKK